MCAPYETDHQLAALFHQGIIDAVVTVDSDLIFLGADVVMHIGNSTGKCWYMKSIDVLEKRIGQEFKIGRDPKWTLEATAFVGSILGNDYIRKVPGAGKKRCRTL